MEHMSHVSCGWGWIERQINRLIDNVNARGVIPSASVGVTETPNGCVLTVLTGTAGAAPNSGGSGGNNPPKVYMMGVQIKEVAVMDPADCSVSSAFFLQWIQDQPTIATEFDVKVNSDGTWRITPLLQPVYPPQ